MANAYISEGVPAEVAERYAAKSAVRSVISNSGNPETPIIMKAAQLNTTSELVEKLVGSLTGSAETVLYQSGHNIVNNRSGHRGRNRGRGNNHGNYRAPGFNNNNGFDNRQPGYRNNSNTGGNYNNGNGYNNNQNRNGRQYPGAQNRYQNPQNNNGHYGGRGPQAVRCMDNGLENDEGTAKPGAGLGANTDGSQTIENNLLLGPTQNIYSLNLNLGSYVRLKTSMAKGHCLFLIDSGATISTFCQTKLKSNQRISNSVCAIRGVGSGSITTLGCVIRISSWRNMT